MSALTPHIRALRAEAGEINKAAAEYEGLAAHPARLTAILIFRGLAAAKLAAADKLEAEDAALVPPREGKDQPITYDPKGLR